MVLGRLGQQVALLLELRALVLVVALEVHLDLPVASLKLVTGLADVVGIGLSDHLLDALLELGDLDMTRLGRLELTDELANLIRQLHELRRVQAACVAEPVLDLVHERLDVGRRSVWCRRRLGLGARLGLGRGRRGLPRLPGDQRPDTLQQGRPAATRRQPAGSPRARPASWPAPRARS